MSSHQNRLSANVVSEVNLILKFYDLYFLRLLNAGVIFDSSEDIERATSYLRLFLPHYARTMRKLQEDISWHMRELDQIKSDWERDFLLFSYRLSQKESKY